MKNIENKNFENNLNNKEIKNENIDFLNLVETDELFLLFDEIDLDIENILEYFNNKSEKKLTLEELKTKKANEIISILSSDNYSGELKELKEILKSTQFSSIYKQTLDYKISKKVLESYKIYNLYYRGDDNSLNVDRKLKYLTKRGTLVDENFKKFLEKIEVELNEKITEDLYIFIKIYNNLDVDNNIFDKKILQKIKDNLPEIRKNYKEFSFGERLNFILRKFLEKNEATELEKSKLLEEIKSNFNEFGAEINEKGLNTLYSYGDIFLKSSLNEKLKENKKYKNFFKKFTVPLNEYEIRSLFPGQNKKILDNSNFGRIISFGNYNSYTVGNNFYSIFSKLSDNITEFLDDNKDKTKEFIEQEFEKFLDNFSIKEIKSIDYFMIILNNFFKYLNLEPEKQKSFLENKNILGKIPLISKSHKFLSDNLGNLSKYDEKTEKQNFLNEIKKLPDIEIDYIPNQKEFSEKDKIFKIYKVLKEEWGISKFKFSDLFLALKFEKFFSESKNIERFNILKKIYNLKENSLEQFLQFKIDFQVSNNANFENENLTLYLQKILSNQVFKYFSENPSKVKEKIIIGNDNISIIDLYIFSDSSSPNVAFNKEIFNEDLQKKFSDLGFSKEEILQIFNFDFDHKLFSVPTSLKGGDLFLYKLKNSKTGELDEILIIFENLKKNIFEENGKNENLYTLSIISDILSQKSDFYSGTKKDFISDLEILQKNNLKLKNIDYILVYLRNLKYNPDLKKYLQNEDFQKFNEIISKKYYFGEKDLFTTIYSVEIFKYLEKNPSFKEEIDSGKYEKVEKVFDFLKNKFGVNNKNHPSILNYAFRFAENFEKTIKIFNKMEELGEKISINDMSVFSIISKEIEADSSKENFFFDKKSLIDYIEKNIYTKQSFQRPEIEIIEAAKTSINVDKNNNYDTKSKEEQLKKLTDGYTERSDLSKMTLKELQHIYINSKIVENLDKKYLENLIDLDVSDFSTEAGGYVYSDFKNGKYETSFFLDPAIGEQDGGYNQILAEIMPGVHFHFHALGYENKYYSGASGYGSLNGGDLPFTYYNNSINLLVTTLNKTEKGKKIGYDLYWLSRDFDKKNPDYSKFKQVDLGSEILKNNKN